LKKQLEIGSDPGAVPGSSTIRILGWS